MGVVLYLFLLQGVLGAADTLYYHEYRARLPAGGTVTRPELALHAGRDFIYTVLFATLPWIEWRGSFAWLLFLLLGTEIVITLADFVVEDEVRRPLGGVFPGERVMHTVMAILYGAILAYLLPIVWSWSRAPSELLYWPAAIPSWMANVMGLMALGVFASGVRDVLSVAGFSWAAWPWRPGPPWGEGEGQGVDEGSGDVAPKDQKLSPPGPP